MFLLIQHSETAILNGPTWGSLTFTYLKCITWFRATHLFVCATKLFITLWETSALKVFTVCSLTAIQMSFKLNTTHQSLPAMCATGSLLLCVATTAQTKAVQVCPLLATERSDKVGTGHSNTSAYNQLTFGHLHNLVCNNMHPTGWKSTH